MPAFVSLIKMSAILAHKGAPEVLDSPGVYTIYDAEALTKVQSELMTALDLLQNFQEGNS
jgi:hypothetical protein